MASQGTSRLAQMQMRFQQRQQQEKEQRRMELSGSGKSTETEVTRTSLTTAKTNNIGNGKVRQMFDERRRGAGIDRSNPLKPIANSSKAHSTPVLAQQQQQQQKVVSNKVYNVRSQETVNVKSTTARKPAVSKQASINRTSRSEKIIIEQQNNNARDELDSDIMSRSFGDHITNDSNNNTSINLKKGTQNGGHSIIAATPQIKLNPVLTKKSPPVRTPTRPSNSSNTPIKRQVNGTMQVAKSEATTARSVNKTPSSGKTPVSARSMASSVPSAHNDAPTGMVACRICGRHFNEDRIGKHEQVCQKMANTKRKVFDASKHRVKGTEAEQFIRRKPNARGSTQRMSTYISAAAATGQAMPQKKSNWRQKHEEFINAIRAAKQVQEHLARGGKLSDLPPPPPSENPDYIQCPHCQRRFNESAAERHIPKCASMLHNKPKPGTQPKRRS